MQHVDGNGLGLAVTCMTLGLCILFAWIVWIVWGVVILVESSAVRYDPKCRAQEFWYARSTAA